MTYEIVRQNSLGEICLSVQFYLNAGWECLGGVSVTSYLDVDGNLRFLYAQALVKDESVESEKR